MSSISDIIAYIEQKGKELGGDYADYEMLAIQILDSQFDEFPEGELEAELQKYLLTKELEINGVA